MFELDFDPEQPRNDQGEWSGSGGSGGSSDKSSAGSFASNGERAAASGKIVPVKADKFKALLSANARADTLSDYSVDELGKMQLFQLQGHDAGYAIKDGNELVNLFNNGGKDTKGAGQWLVLDAVEHGVTKGDHFDGFLTPFYKKLGFTEDHREKNWTAGGPDIVYIKWAGGDKATAKARYRASGHLH